MKLEQKNFVLIRLFSEGTSCQRQRQKRQTRRVRLLLVTAAFAVSSIATAQPFVVPKTPPSSSTSKTMKNNHINKQEPTAPRPKTDQENSHARVDNTSPKPQPPEKQRSAAPDSITRAPTPMSDETQRDHKPD